MFYHLRILINKVEKKFNISLFFFFPLRSLLVIIEFFFLRNSKSLRKLSNYYLRNEMLRNKKINVISAGVGTDISFEEELLKKYKVKKLILIDPTKESRIFLNNKKNKFIFKNKALYTENKKMKIYYQEGNVNLSLENLFNTKKYYLVKCITLNEITKKYSIPRIDVLKLDIEGVADKVIIKALLDNTKIDQICFELERPLSLLKQYDYFLRYFKLIKILKKKNYMLFKCTMLKLGLRSEILAIKYE